MSVIDYILRLTSFLIVSFDNVRALQRDQWDLSEKIIYKFSCSNSMYLLEQTEFIMNLLHMLVSANESRFVDYSNSGCVTSGIYRGKIFDARQDINSSFSQDFGSFIAEELQNGSRSIHLYMFSMNQFTMYRLMAEPDIKILVEGCVLNRLNKINKQRSLAYKAVEDIKKFCIKDVQSDDCISSDSEKFCRVYIDLLIANTNDPGSAPDFRNLVENKSKDEQSAEDPSKSNSVLSSLGRFFNRVATLSAEYWLNMPSGNATDGTSGAAKEDIPITLNTSRFDPLISQLVMSGYEFGRSIRLCQNLICELEAEVQYLYFSNHKRKIVLIIDGYWNYFAFLQFKQDWMDKYVHSIVIISMPMDSSAKNLERSLVNGAESYISTDDDILTKNTLFGAWLEIQEVGTPLNILTYLSMAVERRQGTVDSVEKMMRDAYKRGLFEYLKDYSWNHFSRMELPNVNIHCVYGSGIATSASSSIQFNELQMENSTSLSLEDGDGLFTSKTSNPCAMWKGKREHGEYEKVIKNIHRRDILKSDDFLSYIKKDVLGLE